MDERIWCLQAEKVEYGDGITWKIRIKTDSLCTAVSDRRKSPKDRFRAAMIDFAHFQDETALKCREELVCCMQRMSMTEIQGGREYVYSRT